MSIDAGPALPAEEASGLPLSFRALLHRAQGARERPLVIAHRGDSAHAPENTLEAARAGWHAGADAWELDVHLTRDGIPVVLHDESLVRTTDVAVRFRDDARAAAGFLVSDFDLDEIRVLDAGSWFLSPAREGRTAAAFGTDRELTSAQSSHFGSGAVRIPTLSEALELTLELRWFVNVELKSFPNTSPRLLDAVLRAIDAAGAAQRVLLSSFDHADVARAARVRPEIPTGVLAATPLYRPEGYVRDFVGADAYHPSADVVGAGTDAYRRDPSPSSLRTDDLEALRRHDVPVLVYTVNAAGPGGLAAHLARAGVAGLFTDNPRRLRTLDPFD